MPKNYKLVTSFSQAVQTLGNRNSCHIEHAKFTTLEKLNDTTIGVRYHNTTVVTFYEHGTIKLESGGYHSVTTKRRFNEFTPYHVTQKQGLWTVHTPKGSYPYADGMLIHADGDVDGAKSNEALAADEVLRAKIGLYASAYAAELIMGRLHADEGDCLACQAEYGPTASDILKVAENGDPYAARAFDPSKDTEHLLNHMDEMYFVGHLIMNALVTGPSSIGDCITAAEMLHGNHSHPASVETFHKKFSEIVEEYLKRRLGL